MRKIFKISSQVLSTIIIIMVVIPMALSLLLQNSGIQTWIVRQATNYISKKIDSKISIGRIDIGKYYNVKIYDLYVQSQLGPDTLLYTKELTTRLAGIKMLNHDLALGTVKINGGQFNLYSENTITNIKDIISKIRGNAPKKEGVPPFRMFISDVEIDNFTFRYQKSDADSVAYGINYQDMEMSDMNLQVDNLNIIDDSITMGVKNISMKEKGGLEINRLSFEHLIVSSSEINLQRGDVMIDSTTHFKAPFIKIAYQNWDMADFLNRIPMQAKITDSKLYFSTIEKFTKQKRNWNLIVSFIGTFDGTIANMNGEIERIATGKTVIKNTKYSIKGIPDINNTIFNINIGNLRSRAADIIDIISDFSTTGEIKTPEKLVTNSEFNIVGEFKGSLSNFKTICTLTMPNAVDGKAHVNLNMKKGNGLTINGAITTDNFNTRRFVNIRGLGQLTTDMNINGVMKKNGSLIGVNGKIDLLQYDGYNYNKIKLNGSLDDKAFTGFVGSTDPNLNFEFNGSLDFTNKVPAYNFNLDLIKADLFTIGLNRRDSVSVITGRIMADGSGDNIDNLDATIVIDKLKYINHRDTTIADKPIKIEAYNNATSKSLSVTSEYLDITFRGVHSYTLLLDYIKKSAERYLPILNKKAQTSKLRSRAVPVPIFEKEDTDDYYAITAEIKKPNNIANIFLPSLQLADSTKLAFLFNPSADSFSLTFSSSYIHYNENVATNISIDSKNDGDNVNLFARTEELYINNLYLPNFSIIGNLSNNNIFADFGFSNSSDNTYAVIKTQSVLYYGESKELEYKVIMLPSTLNFYKETWKTTSGTIYINNTEIKIDNFNLASTGQSLNLNGVISENATDTLRLNLDNFSLSPTSLFTSSMGFDIKGGVSGSVVATALKSKLSRKVTTDLSFKNNNINGIPLPDARFTTKWLDDKKKMLFDFTSEGTEFIGGYLDTKNKSYFANVKLDNFNVALISPFMTGIGSNVTGTANIDVTISNPNNYFEINGNVDIPNMSSVIVPTNVKYNISAKAEIKNNQYKLLEGKVTDDDGGSGVLTASMTNEKYKKVKYKIAIKADKMLCLNTTDRDNAQFYGKVYASGDVIITGDRNKVTLGVDAISSKRSTFFLPLGGKSLSEANFIKFAAKEQTPTKKNLIQQKESKKNSTSFEMKMRVTATPLLETEIVMDQTTGSSIKANGNGMLDIDIQPTNDIFTINGEYTLDKGTYRFILPSFKLFDKLFIIKSGSWIRWTGDPLNATLNVDAIYKLKTSLAPLLGSSDQYRNRVNVDCILNIRDQLTHPNITLGKEVPDAGPEEQSILKSTLNTQEAISTQLFFLLISNSFYATGGTAASDVGLTSTTTTGIEFLTSQINNIISSDKFDFGINYRPKSDLSSDEFEIDFSTELLNNKIYLDVTGNYNFMNTPTMNSSTSTNGRQSNWSGDAYITWLLNNSGNLSLKGFTKKIDTFDENQGLQESGFGIYYKVDFDNLKDLKARYKEYKRKRKEASLEAHKKRKEKKLNQNK